MTSKSFQFDYKDLNLTVEGIGDMMGYKEGEDRSLVSDLINDILKEASNICNIKAQYNIYNEIHIDNLTWSIEVSGVIFDVKKIIFSQLKKAESLAVFLCTAGEQFSLLSRQAMAGRDLLRGYIIDFVGSEVTEAAADLLQAELENSLGVTGMKITNRYSPGYCGWNVAEQHKLFSLIPGNNCGITLNDSALMEPVKSVSGIIGAGRNVSRFDYTCRICDMPGCIYRERRPGN